MPARFMIYSRSSDCIFVIFIAIVLLKVQGSLQNIPQNYHIWHMMACGDDEGPGVQSQQMVEILRPFRSFGEFSRSYPEPIVYSPCYSGGGGGGLEGVNITS